MLGNRRDVSVHLLFTVEQTFKHKNKWEESWNLFWSEDLADYFMEGESEVM